MSEPVAAKEPFDISEMTDLRSQNDGTEIEVLDKTGRKTGIKIRVAGPDSDRVRAIQDQIVTERIASRIRVPTAAQLADDAIRITAAAIIGWDGMLERGRVVEYSPAAAVDIMRRAPIIRDQVATVSGDRANF